MRATDAEDLARLEPGVGRLTHRLSRTPLLAQRLSRLGTLPASAETLGPVACAAGFANDARSGGIYLTLGFEPVVREGDDALARLQTRLAEVGQSFELVRKAGSASFAGRALASPFDGTGSATVETPRGAAALRIELNGGVVTAVELETPSGLHRGLIEAVTEQREVADALLGVASLDLSPWGVAR